MTPTPKPTPYQIEQQIRKAIYDLYPKHGTYDGLEQCVQEVLAVVRSLSTNGYERTQNDDQARNMEAIPVQRGGRIPDGCAV